MTDWKVAMLCLLPLMLGGGKARVWCTMMGSSLAAVLFAGMLPAYVVLDALTGAIVLKRPAGTTQRAIGTLYAGMVILDVGQAISPRADGGYLYWWAMSVLSWLQFVILAGWGLHDASGAIRSAFRGHRVVVAGQAGDR